MPSERDVVRRYPEVGWLESRSVEWLRGKHSLPALMTRAKLGTRENRADCFTTTPSQMQPLRRLTWHRERCWSCQSAAPVGG